MKKKNNNKGITLIALVITIIVLLILAGVSIAMLTGQNGILTQASNARLETEYSNITDSISLAVTEYNALKQTDETVAETSFIDWLKGKGYINDNNEIQVANLLGQTMSTGNGTGTSDVYKIEEVTKTAKVASTIKVGVVEAEIEKEYRIVYYDKKGTPTELKTFTLSTPEELEADPSLFIVEDGVIRLKEYNAYYDGSKQWTIENVVIPSEVDGQKVTTIPNNLFCAYQNYNEDFLKFDKIKSIVIPEGVTTIQDGYGGGGTYGAFRNLQNLESVTLPSTLEIIGGNTFRDCIKLKSIVIPENVKSIGKFAFGNTTNIQTITIPGSVTEIKEGAFGDSTGIQEIYIPSTVTTVGWRAFSGWTSEQKIHVPFASTDPLPEGWDDYWDFECNARIIHTDEE